MLSKQPRVSFLSGDEARKLCEHYKLPRPQKVEPVSRTWMHVNFGLYFDPSMGLGNLMLRRVVSEPGWDTLHREFTGLMLARQTTDLPIVDRYQILPDNLIEGRGSLSRLLPGQALASFKDKPEYLTLCEQAGALLKKLSQHNHPHFGSSPNGGVFLPTATSWKGEWSHWANHWIHQARKVGELSEWRKQLETLLEERMSALDTLKSFSLVHGDIHSGNFLALEDDNSARITGLVDWDQSQIGDPLVDWAVVLNAPPEVLTAVVKGYGPEQVRGFLEPDNLARLEAYYLTHLLMRIGILGSDLMRVDGGSMRALGLTISSQLIEEALKPGAVKQRLEDALGGSSTRTDPAATSMEILSRRSLGAIMSGPPIRADQTNDLLLALSAGAMAQLTDGTTADQYTKLGHAVIDRFGAQSISFNETNNITLDQLKSRVFESVMSRPGPGLSLAISLLCGVVTATQNIHGPPHQGVWSALSTLLESTLFLEEHSQPLEGMGRLAHAIMGFDAAITLDAPSGVISRFGAILTEFSGVDAGLPGRARFYLDQGPPPGIPEGQKGKALMPLVLAMARLEKNNRLKVTADAVLQQLGFIQSTNP